jgi:2-keto-4-pentenoate hydratase/2-oxohepta-3-ene-1,7-dioic acid hydratase in catechol pathway
MEESEAAASCYDRVYTADRPEIFFKATPGRCSGQLGMLRIREDAHWNVPEPELALVISSAGKIVGYTIGNDMSSRDIEGDNPLYLPQAKCYNQCCGLGPWITLAHAMPERQSIEIALAIHRDDELVFEGKTSISQMARQFEDLVGWLLRDNDMHQGAFLLTGTGVVPESYDPGQNASDPWGNPLSFTAQYLNALKQGQVSLIDPVTVYACDMEYPFIVDWDDNTLRDDPNGFKPGKCRGRRGAARVPTVAGLNQQLELPDQGEAFATLNTFKIPTLRNVELTGPYMHNGSMKSLIEVAQFYNRGGNVNNKDILQQAIFPFGMPDQDVADLVEFLKSLTDERVRWERAPFDHPSLALPDGSSSQASPINAGFAADQFEMVPAVGKDGRSTVLGPLKSFEDSLPE